jgi:hypothetical protein
MLTGTETRQNVAAVLPVEQLSLKQPRIRAVIVIFSYTCKYLRMVVGERDGFKHTPPISQPCVLVQ